MMKSLGGLPKEQGIAAMQSINVVVLNALFFTAFFGTAALSVILAVYSLLNWQAPGAIRLLAASGIYVVGVILVTIVFNVPLNHALAAVDARSSEGAGVWTRYLSVWTAWNHVRTVAPLGAAVLFMLALAN